jgi:hypothetical protein
MIIEQIRSARPGASVTVTTSNTQVIGYRKNRAVAYIQNTHGSTAIRVGSAAWLTANKGIVVPAGGIYTHYGSGALMAVAASGSVTVDVIDMVGPSNHAGTPRESSPTISSARSQILHRDHKRLFTTLHNADGADTVFIGGHNKVRPDTADIRLAPAQTIVIPGGAAWWAMMDGTNEVQTLTITGTPTGGTYTITYGGFTVTLNHNADATAIQTALRTNPLLAPDNVAVTGTGPFTITFDKELGGMDVTQMVASGTGLTGGSSPAAAITTATPGVSLTAELRIREERRS